MIKKSTVYYVTVRVFLTPLSYLAILVNSDEVRKKFAKETAENNGLILLAEKAAFAIKKYYALRNNANKQ